MSRWDLARTEARIGMVDRIVTEVKSLQMQKCSGDGHLVMLLEMIADDELDYHSVFMQRAGVGYQPL